MAISKIVASVPEALAGIGSGASIAVGGFGLCGVPLELIEALVELEVRDLHVISNNCGTDGAGLGALLARRCIAKMTSSYVGENKELARQFLAGELEVELIPQGTLAERLRAGGCGIPAFYTAGGVGTLVSEGGLPWRYGADGSVLSASPPREVREFGGRQYVLEESMTPDFALVRATAGDRLGNLVFDKTTRNFNPLCAMAGRVTIAEVEDIVEPGDLSPEDIHTPGVFVQRVVRTTGTQAKAIEKRTVRGRAEPARAGVPDKAVRP